MVARFSKQKDQMTLIKAIEYLVKEKKRKKINLLLMGVGKTRKKCEKYIIENNLNEHIKIIEGNFKDLIVKTDLFVLATHYEGLPLVLCEAMASHTPIIATNVPGVNEIIINNKTGLLVKENDVYDLANNILKMKKDLVLRKNFVHQSDIFINKNFNLQLMYNNYIKTIKLL